MSSSLSLKAKFLGKGRIVLVLCTPWGLIQSPDHGQFLYSDILTYSSTSFLLSSFFPSLSPRPPSLTAENLFVVGAHYESQQQPPKGKPPLPTSWSSLIPLTLQSGNFPITQPISLWLGLRLCPWRTVNPAECELSSHLSFHLTLQVLILPLSSNLFSSMCSLAFVVKISS